MRKSKLSLLRCTRVLAPVVISILVGILRTSFQFKNQLDTLVDGGEKRSLIRKRKERLRWL